MKKLLLAGLLLCATTAFGQAPPSGSCQNSTPQVTITGVGTYGCVKNLWVLVAPIAPLYPVGPILPNVGPPVNPCPSVGWRYINTATEVESYCGNDFAWHTPSGAGGGITGPGSATTGFVPLWGDTAASSLTGGLSPTISINSVSCPLGGSCTISGGGMVYPGAGIPNSTGTAWGTSYSTTGSGNVVLSNSPTLVTPALGTPSALVLTNATGLPGGSIVSASVPNSALVNSTLTVNGATCTLGAGCTVSGAAFYQTFQANGTPVTQRAKFNLAAGANTTVVASDNGTDTTTFTVSSTGGGSGGLTSGPLSSRTPTPASPSLYLATDQPRLSELNWWDGTNWTFFNIDNTGLTLNGGATLGIDGTIIPCLTCANSFSANQTEALGAKWTSTHGTNATAGVATLASGTVTISTTAIAALSTGAAGDVVALTLQTCSTCGTLSVGTVTAGTSFVINSTNAGDASHVYWEIRHLN